MIWKWERLDLDHCNFDTFDRMIFSQSSYCHGSFFDAPPRSHAAPKCTAALLEDCTLRGQALCEGLGVLGRAVFLVSRRCLHPVLCRDALRGLPQRGQRFICFWWCDLRPWQSHCHGQSQHSQLQREAWWNLGLEVFVTGSFWLMMESQF